MNNKKNLKNKNKIMSTAREAVTAFRQSEEKNINTDVLGSYLGAGKPAGGDDRDVQPPVQDGDDI